jgi:hypothetical protein
MSIDMRNVFFKIKVSSELGEEFCDIETARSVYNLQSCNTESPGGVNTAHRDACLGCHSCPESLGGILAWELQKSV